MILYRLSAGAVLLLCFTSSLSADEFTAQTALTQRLIKPDLPLQEVQAFTESRIPPMPESESVADWEEYAGRLRRDVLNTVVFRGEANKWRKVATKAEWLESIDGGPGYRIRKLRYEAVPGMWIAALLYEPAKLQGKVPVVMNVNGHDRADGKAADYKQLRCINQTKRGMIALNVEWLGMGQLNSPGFSHYSLNQLNLCGTSGMAPFYLAMSRGLDILLQHENADPSRVAVAGLSGGGWQTIFISSLDTRVTLCNPVAGYSSLKTRARFFSDLGDSEQTPCDFARVADYAQLTAMLAPRAALITKNAEDNCCFRAEHALPPLLQAAKPVYELYGKPANLRHYINHDPGTHNFGQDNRQQLYRMLGDFFYAGDDSFSATEIDSSDEVKSKEELFVDLPENSLDLNALALKLSSSLSHTLPKDESGLSDWQQAQRPVLTEVLRETPPELLAIQQSEKQSAGLRASWWWLRINGEWTVPAVEISRPDHASNGITILVSDSGRFEQLKAVEELLAKGQRVLAVDPFYFGESKISQRDFLFAILVDSTGHRPLGIQSAQVCAVADWAKNQFAVPSVHLLAIGQRTSLIALTAAATGANVASVELRGSLGSLRELIEQNKGMNHVPEAYCFGLLKHFDIAQLIALAGPSKVKVNDPSDRIRQEMSLLQKRLPKSAAHIFSP